jgi:hypothetical protein
MVTLMVPLGQGLSMDSGAVEASRLWFDTGTAWLRGCFPEVKCGSTIVIPQGERVTQ